MSLAHLSKRVAISCDLTISLFLPAKPCSNLQKNTCKNYNNVLTIQICNYLSQIHCSPLSLLLAPAVSLSLFLSPICLSVFSSAFVSVFIYISVCLGLFLCLCLCLPFYVSLSLSFSMCLIHTQKQCTWYIFVCVCLCVSVLPDLTLLLLSSYINSSLPLSLGGEIL